MIASLSRSIGRTACRVRSDRRGFALTEFAFTAPVLILLYLGSFQLCDAISAQRRVSTTARAMTDLASQYQIVSTADLNSILAASTQIMAPYDISKTTLIVSEIDIDGSGRGSIAWSQGLNATARETGSTFTLPTAIRQNNTSLILSEVTYNYSAGVAAPIIGNIILRDKTYMSPRTVRSITRT